MNRFRRLLRTGALAATAALGAGSGQAAGDPACPAGDYPALYDDAAPFESALEMTEGIAPWDQPVTAVVVPHHLAVPDLVAGGLRLAATRRPERIILLFPDHFRRSPAPFAVTPRGFSTPLGPVPADAPAARGLIEPGLVAESCLFGADHGLQALLPFIARLFPAVPVVPVAVALNSTRADWERMARRLEPLAGPGALMVQSTDFSHYLPAWQARQRDQEVMNLLAAADGAGLSRLIQPAHADSVGALWLTFTIQQRLHRAAPLVVASRNQQELTSRPLAETTSYMVVLYVPTGSPAARTPFPGSHLYMLGGDTFLGRTWWQYLYDELPARRVAEAVLSVTHGLPLVLNLEGVLLPEQPATLPHMTLAMPAELLLEWARRLNVAGFGLANNHADDLGAAGRAETEAVLSAAGLPFAGQGGSLDLPGVTLLMLSDLTGGADPAARVLDAARLDRLMRPDPAVPVVAFVHWGEEWKTSPGPREWELIRAMAARGVAAIVGAHPHAASPAPFAVSGGTTLVIQSLGNFLFDQASPPASGAVAEMRTFAQGTLFLRQLPLPPLYDIARGRHGE